MSDTKLPLFENTSIPPVVSKQKKKTGCRLLHLSIFLTGLLIVAIYTATPQQATQAVGEFLESIKSKTKCHGSKFRHHSFSPKINTSVFHRSSLNLLMNIDEEKDHSHAFTFKKAAVACDVPECSTMAKDILLKGGSAVDAAVTTALCIGSVNSFSSGIGGGGFILVSQPNGSSLAFNAREMAPAAAYKDMYKNNPWGSKLGGLAVGIPGELEGLYQSHLRYGKLPWEEVIQPVIELNRRGFKVSEPLARAMDLVADLLLLYADQWFWLLEHDEKTGKLRVKRENEIIKRENFADTLELIAKNGTSKVFYDPEGPIAPHLVRSIQQAGGIATLEDFTKYNVEITDPIYTKFLGREVLTTPNPSSGPILLFGLNVMDGFKDNDNINQTDFDPIATQRLVETMKWMGSARSQLGDPVDIDNSDTIKTILAREWADGIRRNISDDHTNPWQEYDPAYEPVDPHGTAHFSIVDENGMAVSMTTTINLFFGSFIADRKTGIVLNNEMDDFSVPKTKNAFELEPSIYNYIAPFKRPLSSCVPTVIRNMTTGQPEFVIGAAGGSHILTSVFQAIVRKIMYEETLEHTIKAGRIHHQLLPDHAELEKSCPGYVLLELKDRGHQVVFDVPKSVANGIYLDEAGVHAVSDWWRKRGQPDGY